MGFCQSNQCSCAGGIVDRSIANVIAIGRRRAATKMVPVRCVDNIFILALCPWQHPDDILRGIGADVVAERCPSLEAQRHRREIRFFRSSHQGIEILPCSFDDLPGRAFLDPAIHNGHRRSIRAALGIGLRAGPAAFNHVPAVGGWRIVVDNQCGSGSLAGGFFVLVGPAAVIGHRLAAKGPFQRFRAEIGIVDKNEGGFARHVHALVIVPVPLRRVDAVTDEHNLAVLQHRLASFTVADSNPVRGEVQGYIGGSIVTRRGDRQRGKILASDFHQRHVLNPPAIIARLQARFFELLDQQGNGLLPARGARHPAFKSVGR